MPQFPQTRLCDVQAGKCRIERDHAIGGRGSGYRPSDMETTVLQTLGKTPC